MSTKNTKWLETLTDLKWDGNAAEHHVADKEGVSVFGDIWMKRIGDDLVRDTNRIKIGCVQGSKNQDYS